MKSTLVILLLLCSFTIYSQEISLDSTTVNWCLRSIESRLKRERIIERFTCERLNKIETNILDEKFAATYAVEAFKKLYPYDSLEKHKHGITVREDNSKKLWVVVIYFPEAMDGMFAFIYSKNDGQLIYYGNHW